MLRHPAAPYVAPFAVFILFLAFQRYVPVPPEVIYPLRLAVVGTIVWIYSRTALESRPTHWLGSILLGVAVFAIWVAPDVLWPGYRSHWLFTNPVTGAPASSVPPGLKENLLFIVFRSFGCAILVPVVEELFWRGWLGRWLITPHDFRESPLGAYTASAFWTGSVLFASEHGSYWEVGLIAGCLYNWWMIRTRNLADCILSHAVTNACLSAYVLQADQWQYWL